jgi:hypothetical protein
VRKSWVVDEFGECDAIVLRHHGSDRRDSLGDKASGAGINLAEQIFEVPFAVSESSPC